MFDDLVADENFGGRIVYIPSNDAPVEVTALVSSRDELLALGQIGLEQDVLKFTVRASDLPTPPKRGDLVQHLGRTRFVGAPGILDPDGLQWTFLGSRMEE